MKQLQDRINGVCDIYLKFGCSFKHQVDRCKDRGALRTVYDKVLNMMREFPPQSERKLSDVLADPETFPRHYAFALECRDILVEASRSKQ